MKELFDTIELESKEKLAYRFGDMTSDSQETDGQCCFCIVNVIAGEVGFIFPYIKCSK